jgi:hypothetical protein
VTMYVIRKVCECARVSIVRTGVERAADVKTTPRPDCPQCCGNGTVGVYLTQSLPWEDERSQRIDD